MENEITTFDASTTWNRRGKPPVVNLSTYGHIRFSVEAVKLLNLKEGMKIAFRIDTRDAGIIYFYEQATGIPLRKGMNCKTGKRLEVYCRPLSLKLLNFFGFNTRKTFKLTKEQSKIGNCNMWFILKDNIHKPIKWKPIA